MSSATQKTIDSIDGVDTGVDPSVVYYHIVQCPVRRCRSVRAPVYHTEPGGVVRFHRCEDCGKTFKSILYPLIKPEM